MTKIAGGGGGIYPSGAFRNRLRNLSSGVALLTCAELLSPAERGRGGEQKSTGVFINRQQTHGAHRQYSSRSCITLTAFEVAVARKLSGAQSLSTHLTKKWYGCIITFIRLICLPLLAVDAVDIAPPLVKYYNLSLQLLSHPTT